MVEFDTSVSLGTSQYAFNSSCLATDAASLKEIQAKSDTDQTATINGLSHITAQHNGVRTNNGVIPALSQNQEPLSHTPPRKNTQPDQPGVSTRSNARRAGGGDGNGRPAQQPGGSGGDGSDPNLLGRLAPRGDPPSRQGGAPPNPGDPDPSGSTGNQASSGGGGGPQHGGTAKERENKLVATVPSEVLSIIAKMFTDPIPNPTPQGLEYMPSGTEVLRNKLEEDFTRYSPVMWADPLIPYEIKVVDGDVAPDDVTAIGVDVNNGFSKTPTLGLSALGIQIKTIVDAEISQTGAIRALMPVAGLKDQRSIATVMHMCDIDSGPQLDEAALMRILLLQCATMDAYQQVYTSSAVNSFAINMCVKRADCSLTWTKCLDTSDKLQIGSATSTSNLYFRTIDEYAALISGNATDGIYIRDKSKNRIDISDVVFVPVKSAWRGQAWLVPYILSFTTTTWWNHAITVDVKYTNTVAEKTAGNTMKARFMPRAATVYIPGSFTNICLIVTDSTRQSFPDNQDYIVCRGITASRSGNFEFAEQAYAYLGRRVDTSVRGMAITDITQALNHMIEHMCTRTEFRQLQVKCAVLSTSRFNGFGCYPTPDAPAKAPESGETDRDHIFGPATFNTKDSIKIGTYKLPDLVSLTNDDRKNRLEALKTWRCDPLGYFSYGLVNTKKDESHKPCIYEYKAGCLQYQLSETSANMRVLRSCGIFVQDPDTDRHILQKPVDVYNTTIGYGSLILGLSNWAFMELGVTVFEHNRTSRRWRCLHDQYLELWPVLTSDFVVRTSEFVDRSIDIEKYQKLWGWVMNQRSKPENVPTTWTDTHYSWNCPWWYVAAIATKFDHKFLVKTNPNGELVMDQDHGDSNNMLGWLISPSESNQYDLSLLTSSCQYERRVRRSKPAFFDILTPTSNGKDEGYNFLSWDLNSVLDAKKTDFRSKAKSSPPDTAGVVELNIVVFPSARMLKMHTCPRSFVSIDNRVDGRDESTYPVISNGLKWPDPWLDWLLKGGMAVLPHVITGNWIGALGSGLAVVVDALAEWAASQEAKNQTFRE
ncbi:hypothetical protein [Bactrocera dorsalis toti-like virus 2]|uniref:Uncharacterized protein n=1 Tax=Bactrocera dorsalis toti-like virus 2 TaxID=2760898 RepID=A0A7G4YW92_9VIRU|nr:hypothetical protein [Bactrocera dorsalis toti-like virus 2]